ncbi:unnamed protein product [Phaedon cochleariae]|uniref:Uncharacterized protein n=1 Tax=Phaedon cochleariae TaxID=80249 RepID=A0A9P0DH95_PHACE|nr:unnamed protein product [Phaedon cochleariae]
MIKTTGFYDLCIQESLFTSLLTNNDLIESLKSLHNFGYRTIAVNQSIDDGNIEVGKKKKKREPRETQDIVPVPFNLKRIQDVVAQLQLENFVVLNRLTVFFSHQEALHKITKSTNYKKFHIIAAAPTTMPAFTFTCTSLEADIFSFNPENKFNMRLNRKHYNLLIDRGFHFELLYSAAIQDSTKRKNLIHASHLFHAFGKSKNIIFSSGAENFMYIRSPYDIINLGFIFGLSELQCKSAVFHCPSKVVLNSVGRRHGKAVMFVENIESEKEDVIMLQESEGEDMETDQPRQKKTKI